MKVQRTLLKQVTAILEEKLNFYSQFNPSPLSVKKFTDFGRHADLESSYLFLKKELPVRLANIMKEFKLIPESLQDRPSLVAVKDLYRQSFHELLEWEDSGSNLEGNLNKFTDNLVRIRDRHADVVMQTAAAIMEMKERNVSDTNDEFNIQYFLDRFYMSRISIRMLINQHTLLFGPQSSQEGRHIGCIDPECNITSVIEDAYDNARFLCDAYYLCSPALEIIDVDSEYKPTVDYVPSHLYHMLFELFKNAMRAVVEHHGVDSTELPPLKVILVKGKEDLTIKLSDQGGGIPRSHMDLLFNYMYSTAPNVGGEADMTSPPLAGYGFGLPLSRLYARYFQGDLTLTSVEGYGTDAIVYLKSMSDEANELLPVYNKTCQRQYNSPHQTNDWSNQLHSSIVVRPFSSSSRHFSSRRNFSNNSGAWKNLQKNEFQSNANSNIDLHRHT